MSSSSDDQPSIRVLLAVGNAERERRLLEGLPGDGLVVAGRCLDGPSLAERAGGADVDVALASSDLHRLSAAVLTAVRDARLPLVLIADGQDVSRYGELAHLVPASASASDVTAALRAAVRRGPVYSAPAASAQIEDAGMQGSLPGGDGDAPRGRLMAVVSGKGAPGKTTVAIGLAAALAERRREVVLVDADPWGGNVGAYLDLDPQRGLFALAYGKDASPNEWAGRLDEELQEGPGFMVLGGIERAEQRSAISADVMTAATAALGSAFDDVVVDAGCAIAGAASPATDALLRQAERILVVSEADLVAVWNARAALRYLREGLGVEGEAIGIVLKRREGREHYDAEEVERALGAPVLAALPEDRKAAGRAVGEQVPLTAVGGGAARELRRLASALAGREAAVRAGAGRRRRWRLAFRRA
ncbi:MAG: P-loop NTPase [Chloroflexota bacterium]|nr:P-loop NTPase [Chloroflexota bacterium]